MVCNEVCSHRITECSGCLIEPVPLNLPRQTVDYSSFLFKENNIYIIIDSVISKSDIFIMQIPYRSYFGLGTGKSLFGIHPGKGFRVKPSHSGTSLLEKPRPLGLVEQVIGPGTGHLYQ